VVLVTPEAEQLVKGNFSRGEGGTSRRAKASEGSFWLLASPEEKKNRESGRNAQTQDKKKLEEERAVWRARRGTAGRSRLPFKKKIEPVTERKKNCPSSNFGLGIPGKKARSAENKG